MIKLIAMTDPAEPKGESGTSTEAEQEKAAEETFDIPLLGFRNVDKTEKDETADQIGDDAALTKLKKDGRAA